MYLKKYIFFFNVGSDYGPIPEELWQFFLNAYSGGPEVMIHSCQRPVPPHNNLPTHSVTSSNLGDFNTKLNRQPEVKPKQITDTKSTESISMPDINPVVKNTTITTLTTSTTTNTVISDFQSTTKDI